VGRYRTYFPTVNIICPEWLIIRHIIEHFSAPDRCSAALVCHDERQ
jgi:hypothetical protein